MSQDVGQAQSATLTRFCTACGKDVEVADRFCGACGHALDEIDTSSIPPTQSEEIAGEWAEPPSSGRSRWPLVAGGVGLAVLLSGAGVAATIIATQPHPEDDVLAESAADTVALLETMASAETTADLRESAEDAEVLAEPVVEILPTLDPSNETAQSLSALSEVLAGIEALDGVDGQSLDEWSEINQDLESALDLIPTDDPALEQVAVVGWEAVDAVDTLVTEAEATIAAWEADVAEAEAASAENAAAVTELTDYENAVKGQLSTYASLRNDTASFVELAGDPDGFVTYEQGRQALSEGASARREVRSALTTLVVPAGMEAEHGRLVAMVEDAAAAMDAGVSAIDDADYCVTSCYVFGTEAWQTFEDESSRISGEFGSAQSAWETRIAELRGALGEVPAPPMPVV